MRLAGYYFIRWGIFCLPVFFIVLQTKILSQRDSILQLKEIEITAQRINLTEIGKHTDHIDSGSLHHHRHENLASLLNLNTPLFIRTYGSGTLATLGIRGGNASHTQLLWNGIPLRNPMLGLVDLALIPSFFIDEAAVHYGGHGAAFGSGAVGGLISMSNQLKERNEISVHAGAGSWDKRIAAVNLNYGSKSIRFSTRVFSQFAENNYRYRIAKNFPERNQVHHQLKNAGLLQEINWALNEKERITARLWYQESDREIPPLTTQTTSKSAQQDQSIRIALQWMRHGKSHSWQIKTAWMNEVIDYQDSLILLYTQNQFRTWIGEAETSFRLGEGVSFTGGLYAEISEATSANYLAGTSRNQEAAFTSVRFIKNDFMWRVQLREEVTDTTWSPVLLDFSAEWTGIKHFTFKASVSRNYRIPTLNDLHWRPGGNPGLKPEKGWTTEAGLNFAGPGNNSYFKASLTAYTRTIDQWIMWMPPVKDVSNYWSPINVAIVHSRGVETRLNYMFSVNKYSMEINTGLDLTWSEFGTALPDFMISPGDQLFYVPVENVLTGFRIEKGNWAGYYNHHWFGDSPGINDDLQAGHVGSGGVSINFDTPKLNGSLYLQAENVWNVPYRIIERRPMPGRTFTAGFQVTVF